MEKLYEKISILNKLSDVSEAKKDRAHKHLALVMKLWVRICGLIPTIGETEGKGLWVEYLPDVQSELKAILVNLVRACHRIKGKEKKTKNKNKKNPKKQKTNSG